MRWDLVEEATGGVDHNYDDGYNRVKDEGNVAGLTWNWGYANVGQIVGDNVVMRRSLPGELTREFKDDPQQGAELTYSRRLGRVTLGVELLDPVGVPGALLVPLVDRHLHAVADVDPEIGVVPRKRPDEGDGDGLLLDATARGGVVLLVRAAGGQHQGRGAEHGDETPDAPPRSTKLGHEAS